MFTKNFYPTPTSVIEKMLAPYHKESQRWHYGGLDFSGLTILEPSAGKGNIVEYINEHTSQYGNPDAICCIEKHPDLQAILREKRFDVIGEDFLTFDSPYAFDLIIMNPPFDEGAKHLLKAWEMLHTGDIICLLNAETYRNPHSKERQLLKNIIDEYGSLENLGDCFADAERKTNVDVFMVRLQKTSKSAFEFDATAFEKEDNLEFPDDLEANQVEVLDVLLSYERRYTASVSAFKELVLAIQKFRYYTDDVFIPSYGLSDYLKLAADKDMNAFIRKFNTVCWNKILSESKFESFLTTNVRRSFSEKFSHQTKLAFTKTNMLTLFEILWQNKADILESCIEDVFDIMTKYYHENRQHIEGWKTNDAWRVNRKVILPFYVSYGKYSDASWLKKHGSKFSINRASELLDIDRCMSYIMGSRIEHICTLSEALKRHFDYIGTICTGEKFEKQCQSTYFDIRFFKKGTLHITFREEYLWREFNFRAAQYKGFPLPERMHRKGTQKATQTENVSNVASLFPVILNQTV